MNKKLKKIFALLGVCVLSISMLAGCGNSKPTDVTTNDETVETSTTESESTTETDTNIVEKTQVELWHYFSASNQEVLEKMIEDFNASQDSVEVIPTYIARADLMKQYTMGAISGELPDIGMVDSPDMASFVTMGVFEDITDLATEWGELDNFYEGPLNSCTADGKIYGLPQNTNCLAIYYNLDLFKAAGLSEEDVPTTWDELYEVSKKLTSNDTYGFAFSAKGTEEGTFTYIPWLYSAGADIESLASDKAVASMEYLTKLVEEGIVSKEVVNWGQTDVRDAFIAGKAAIMQNGSWQIATLNEMTESGELSFEYGTAYIPMDEKNASVIGGENFGLCTGANKEASFEFFKFMMGKEGNAEFNLAAGKFPTRADSMATQNIWTTDKNYKVFTESMNFAVTRGPHAEWPTISEGIYTALQASLLGEKKPEQAMQDAAAQAATVIN